MVIMSYIELPWSYVASIVSFGIFFASLNIYILTALMSHPFASPFWLVGVVVGIFAMIYSYKMVRIHQKELIEKKNSETA